MPDLKERARELARDIPAVFMSLKDAETPFAAKLLGFVTIAYALSPIDIIPDFIPVLGYLDDLIILPALVAATVKLIPKDVFKRNREAAKGMWENGKPKKWYFAIPIVLLWLLIIWLIVRRWI